MIVITPRPGKAPNQEFMSTYRSSRGWEPSPYTRLRCNQSRRFSTATKLGQTLPISVRLRSTPETPVNCAGTSSQQVVDIAEQQKCSSSAFLRYGCSVPRNDHPAHASGMTSVSRLSYSPMHCMRRIQVHVSRRKTPPRLRHGLVPDERRSSSTVAHVARIAHCTFFPGKTTKTVITGGFECKIGL